MTVSDTGVGIPTEDLAAIFMPFWSKRADGVSGTGLGLAICRSVLRTMDGTIAVSSQPGSGSRFTINLPDPDSQGS